jgi:flagellar export protein FliJ
VSALDTIIRVHRWQLDERRQQLAELERLEERLRGEERRLDDELLSEQRAAAASPEAASAYPNYAKALADRRAKLTLSLQGVQAQLVQAREALAESFAEVKRYEMAQATRDRRTRATAARKQQIQQDEVAMQIYRRTKAG